MLLNCFLQSIADKYCFHKISRIKCPCEEEQRTESEKVESGNETLSGDGAVHPNPVEEVLV